MLLDSQLLFSNTQSVTNSSTGTTSTVINLVAAEDLGIGSGQAQPIVVVQFPTGLTGGSSSSTVNIQFQGSTDSTNWTPYMETGANSTASYTSTSTWRFAWPRRSPGAKLPQYVRLNYVVGGGGSATLTSGTVFASVTLDDFDDGLTLGQYANGYTVIS